MATAITVRLRDVQFLAGVKGIDLLIDDVRVGDVDFGEGVFVEVEAGMHSVQIVLHGVLRRESKRLVVDVPQDESVAVVGKYSRLWGTIKLSIG